MSESILESPISIVEAMSDSIESPEETISSRVQLLRRDVSFYSTEKSELAKNGSGSGLSLMERLFKLIPEFFLSWMGRTSNFSIYLQECPSLLQEISKSEALRTRICELREADAQNMVDFIDLVRLLQSSLL